MARRSRQRGDRKHAFALRTLVESGLRIFSGAFPDASARGRERQCKRSRSADFRCPHRAAHRGRALAKRALVAHRISVDGTGFDRGERAHDSLFRFDPRLRNRHSFHLALVRRILAFAGIFFANPCADRRTLRAAERAGALLQQCSHFRGLHGRERGGATTAELLAGRYHSGHRSGRGAFAFALLAHRPARSPMGFRVEGDLHTCAHVGAVFRNAWLARACLALDLAASFSDRVDRRNTRPLTNKNWSARS